MKHVIALIALSLATSASANQNILKDIQHLPRLGQVSTHVVAPHPFTTVEPTSWISFEFASCARYDLEVETKKLGPIHFVKVRVPVEQRDCFGPTITRKYELQLSSEASFSDNYVVLNPIGDLQQF